jgi:hypothetical protein
MTTRDSTCSGTPNTNCDDLVLLPMRQEQLLADGVKMRSCDYRYAAPMAH